MAWTYMLRGDSGRYYIGSTINLTRRLEEHRRGDPTPSEADIKVTRDLIRAGQLLKIDVLDHVILGQATEGRPKDYSSLRELGYCTEF